MIPFIRGFDPAWSEHELGSLLNQPSPDCGHRSSQSRSPTLFLPTLSLPTLMITRARCRSYPSSPLLNPVSFDHVPASAVDILATKDQLHRLQPHQRLPTSHSDPQHRSDATSAILHWIYLSCIIRLKRLVILNLILLIRVICLVCVNHPFYTHTHTHIFFTNILWDRCHIASPGPATDIRCQWPSI